MKRKNDMPRSTPLWLRITVLALLATILLCAFVFSALALIRIWARYQK